MEHETKISDMDHSGNPGGNIAPRGTFPRDPLLPRQMRRFQLKQTRRARKGMDYIIP